MEKNDPSINVNKKIIENKALNENEINGLLSLDFSTVKPKKHMKNIQKLISIVDDYSKYQDIKNKTDHLSQKIEQLKIFYHAFRMKKWGM